MPLTVPAPAALEGDQLETELETALGRTGISVTYHPADATLVVDGASAGDRTTVEDVLARHTPPPAPQDPQQAFVDAVQSATTLDQLKAALLGNRGPGAEPRRRPK